MPAEQPPKTICEICGGAHSTSAHVPIVENAQEEESTQEKEPNREAMKKVVDILATEDLKYRKPIMREHETLTDYLERGIHTPLSLSDDPAKTSQARELERRGMQSGLRYGGVDETFRQRGNVYYPEGLLKALRDKLLGTTDIEIYGKVKSANKDEDITTGGIAQLYRAYFSLRSEEQDEISKLSRHTEKEISVLLKKWDLEKDTKDENHSLLEIIKSILGNSKSWEIIRKAWLQTYFDAIPDGKKVSSEFSDWGRPNEYGRCAYWEYGGGVGMGSIYGTHDFGVVLSPDVKVAISPHVDFPTQATIMAPYVGPEQVIGIIFTDAALAKYNWDDLVREVNRFQVPIYNNRGDLLWPKGLTHNEIAKLAVEKLKEKE